MFWPIVSGILYVSGALAIAMSISDVAHWGWRAGLAVLFWPFVAPLGLAAAVWFQIITRPRGV